MSIFWINGLKYYKVCFYCMSKLRTTKMYWNWGAGHFLLLHMKLFFKRKISQELVSLPHSLTDFWRKIFRTFSHLTKFHCLIPFISWYIGQYMYWNYLLSSLWRHKFEITLAFLSCRVFTYLISLNKHPSTTLNFQIRPPLECVPSSPSLQKKKLVEIF